MSAGDVVGGTSVRRRTVAWRRIGVGGRRVGHRVRREDIDRLMDRMSDLEWMVKDLITRLRVYGG